MRGTVIGPTVDEMIEMFILLKNNGLGNSIVEIWEPNIDDWAEVGYATYDGRSVRLYHE